MKTLHNFWFATVVPALIGFGFAVLSIRYFEQYGWSLFLGLPVLVCFLSAFCTSFRRSIPFSQAYWTSVTSLLILGGFILVFAIDGLICLIMALPLALMLAVPGAALGRAVGKACMRGIDPVVPLLLIWIFPGLIAFEAREVPVPQVRSVTSSVIVNAPAGRVWDIVVAFPQISEPPGGIFQLGVAYPVEARIEGQGVGAIRYCTFSTGSFVEPITDWERPKLLAFNVTANPEPMKEFSFYKKVHAPHLHGYMVSRRGQFRLIERDGHVVLEGTTWYTHSLYPLWYWGLISDGIIHRIHGRVLNHIKRIAEAT